MQALKPRPDERLESLAVSRTNENTRTRESLEARDRLAAIGELAATIVHEIRNPLATITLNLSRIERSTVCEEAKARIAETYEETLRLNRLVREILLYAAPCSLERRPTKLDALCAEVAARLRARPELAGRDVEIACPRGSVVVAGDPDKLRQVVDNLLLNALEASPVGQRVRCSVEPIDSGALLRVCNRGAPIAPADLARVTDLFFTTKPGGTGLGLPLVKRIVQAHGGTLQIVSDARTGTCVTVSLPADGLP